MKESSTRLKHPILQGILMFCVFFDVSFIQLPSIISARKITFVILFVLIAVKKRTITFGGYGTNHIKKLSIVSIFVLLYAIVVCNINGVIHHQGSIIPRLAYFIIYALLGCVLLVNYFDSEIDFMRAAILGLWLQCIATIAIFFVPNVSAAAKTSPDVNEKSSSRVSR